MLHSTRINSRCATFFGSVVTEIPDRFWRPDLVGMYQKTNFTPNWICREVVVVPTSLVFAGTV